MKIKGQSSQDFIVILKSHLLCKYCCYPDFAIVLLCHMKISHKTFIVIMSNALLHLLILTQGGMYWLAYHSSNYFAYLFLFLQAIMEEANRCGNDIAKLKDILSSILLICKVFYSLNFQVIFFIPSEESHAVMIITNKFFFLICC